MESIEFQIEKKELSVRFAELRVEQVKLEKKRHESELESLKKIKKEVDESKKSSPPGDE